MDNKFEIFSYIDYGKYWSMTEIMNILSVRKNWIHQNIQPYIEAEKPETVEDRPYIVNIQNTNWYRKDILFDYFIKNMKVYTRDYEHTTEQDRGEEIEIVMPQEIKNAIINGKFEFINMKRFQAITGYKSRESVYRALYRLQAYSIKLFGRTYYYIP